MARRKDHSPQELKEQVITKVIQFLQQQPANELSLRKIAKMVGYSPGTLINLFGNYAYLLLAVNAVTLEQINQQLSDSMRSSQQAQQQLTLFAQQYLNFAQQHPFQWRLLFEHQLTDEQDLPQWQQQKIEHLFSLIDHCLEKLKPNANSKEIQQTSRTIWASVHGICALSIDDKLFHQHKIDSKEMINSLLEHYLTAWQQSKITGA